MVDLIYSAPAAKPKGVALGRFMSHAEAMVAVMGVGLRVGASMTEGTSASVSLTSSVALGATVAVDLMCVGAAVDMLVGGTGDVVDAPVEAAASSVSVT
jgi:hypothetical protein